MAKIEFTPERGEGRRLRKYPFAKATEVGDYFDVPVKDAGGLRNAAYYHMKRHGPQFVTTTIGDVVRCFRAA